MRDILMDITIGDLMKLQEGEPPTAIGLDCAEVIPVLAKIVLDLLLEDLSIGDAVVLERRRHELRKSDSNLG